MLQQRSYVKALVGLVTLACAAMLSFGAHAHGVSEADQAAMETGSNWEYIVLGARHMVTGYDHLLFLFGVMFFLTRFGEIVKFVTAFTLGHTVTLIGATYAGIQANYFLVDAVIACTVAYKGFDNLDGFKKYLNVKAPNLVGAVFVFGLIHGFGLSTRLQELPILGEGLFLRIVSFNVGVELGQIAALVVMLLALSVWRHTATFTKFSGLANSGLIGAGCLLLLMQLHGYSHTQNPNEFGFPEEEHNHAHEHDVILTPEGEHTHDDGTTHADHAEDAVPEGQHVHEDGTTHEDHSVSVDPPAVEEGQHVHEDGSVHEHHDVWVDPPPVETGEHVHEDGSVHADHDAPTPVDSAPEGEHTHEDGSTHADHEVWLDVQPAEEDEHDHPHQH